VIADQRKRTPCGSNEMEKEGSSSLVGSSNSASIDMEYWTSLGRLMLEDIIGIL
jgi:hypothetical protein